MTTQQYAEVASEILNRRVNGTQGESFAQFAPQSIEDALAIQAAVTELWCESQDDSIGGWKCLEPSATVTVVAPIYTRTINSVAPVSMFAERGVARIEPELAFIMGEDLPPRDTPYTHAEIDAAIGRTHMALELLHCRFTAPEMCSFPEKLADGLVNQGLFIGPEIDSVAAIDASRFKIEVTYNGETFTFDGVHPNGLPRKPLYWLVEFLRSRGQGLVKGQAVITGSYAGVIEVPFNTDMTISYKNLGQMSVEFTPKSA